MGMGKIEQAGEGQEEAGTAKSRGRKKGKGEAPDSFACLCNLESRAALFENPTKIKQPREHTHTSFEEKGLATLPLLSLYVVCVGTPGTVGL